MPIGQTFSIAKDATIPVPDPRSREIYEIKMAVYELSEFLDSALASGAVECGPVRLHDPPYCATAFALVTGLSLPTIGTEVMREVSEGLIPIHPSEVL